MAKFSVWKDDEEEDNEEEFCMRSPKRRRIYHPQASTSDSNSNADNDHPKNHQEKNEHVDDEIDSTARSNKLGEPISVILSDPDVLDCSICFEPLTIPVFQCDNGHIACSSCCNNLGDKCPSCCGKIGNNRCRAIEKVIESVRVSCCYSRYGCTEIVSYCKKHEHEEKCIFAPCSCPFPNCLFRGSPRKLSRHMGGAHSDVMVRFNYNSVFSVSVSKDENFIVLQEERDGSMFFLTHGNSIAVRCIDPKLPTERFPYNLTLYGGGSLLNFQSRTHFTTGQLSDPPSVDYVLVPGYFYNTGGRLRLDICIRNKGTSHLNGRR